MYKGYIYKVLLALGFLCVLLLNSSIYAYSQKSIVRNDYVLVKPHISDDNYSGDKQHENIGKKLSKIIRFQVLKNDTSPVVNYPVYVSILSMPAGAKGFKIHTTRILTDDNGIARTYITLGSNEGEYSIIARIKSSSDKSFLVYTFFARSSTWVLFLLIGLLGGLGLFLFGMEMMSSGLQKSAGDKMRTILGRFTNNRFIAFGSGAVFTMIIQSSSAMAVMLMSFVNTRLMQFKSTIPILIGAAVGTTITAQLIALKITDYAILFVGIGAALYLFSKKNQIRNNGEAVLGFGILFFGLKIMSDAMYPLRSWDPFINLLLSFENPFLGIAAGALFTALIHSSSACIGIIMIFAGQGLLSLESGIYLLLGANLGTPSTALIASVKASIEAKKVAYAQLFYKIIMITLFIGFVPLLVHLLNYYSFHNAPVITNEMLYDALPRQIANAHTFINIILALIIFPLIPLYIKFLDKIFPEPEIKPLYTIKYLDNNIITTPTLALNLAKQETLRLGRKVYIITDEILVIFLNNDIQSLDSLALKRDEIKAIRDEIKTYILKLSPYCDEKRINESFQIIHVLQELSHINDVITKILHRRAEKWIDRHYEFSQEGKAEIIQYHKHTLSVFKNALEVFETLNLEKAKDIHKHRNQINEFADQLEKTQYERIIKGNSIDLENSKTHMEIINMLNIITQYSVDMIKPFIPKIDTY